MGRFCAAVVCAMVLFAKATCGGEFVDLFPTDGSPAGWHVTAWTDVGKAGPEGAAWKVEQGVLQGSTTRGTWLVSDREYGDFVLELEFKLGERGNSGVGLRFPLQGDPAFSGLELQMIERGYFGDKPAAPAELTGAFYRAIPPTQQAFKPGEWNRCQITCEGPQVKVVLNDMTVQDVDLSKKTAASGRGTALAQRPLRGHLGFQELSRGGTPVEIRKARIKELGK
jgi:hypothetical protein